MKPEFNDNQGSELALCLLELHKNPGPCKPSSNPVFPPDLPESKELYTTLRIMAPVKIRRIDPKSVAQCSQGFGGDSFVLGRSIRIQNIIISFFILLKLESLRQGTQISYCFTHTQRNIHNARKDIVVYSFGARNGAMEGGFSALCLDPPDLR